MSKRSSTTADSPTKDLKNTATVVQYAKAIKEVVDNYALLKKLRRKNHQNNDLEIKKKLKQVDNAREL